MPSAALALTREQILAFRRRMSALDERPPMSPESLRRAAWAGLQDSMPRAALLAIHARVAQTPANVLDDPDLIQVWGPRYSVYVVATSDVPIFTLSRLPDDDKGRRRAEQMADRLESFLQGRRLKDRDVHAALGTGNAIRYATTTGRVAIRWEGALAPTVWMLPRPEMSVGDARKELARRYLHVFGPTTAAAFAGWAGIAAKMGAETFGALRDELVAVRTPIGDACLLAADEAAIRAAHEAPAAVRLLPSGDTYFLLWGRDRELLLPDEGQRAQLWTSRVWPGAVLVAGEILGVWRRSNEKITVHAWRSLTAPEKVSIEAEAAALPLPALRREVVVAWTDGDVA